MAEKTTKAEIGEQLAIGMPDPGFKLDGDMTAMGERLIAENDVELGHLRNFQLRYLRRSSRRTDMEFHPAKCSGVFIRQGRERAIYAEADAGVWLMGMHWDRFDPSTQRRPWLHSLLLRLQMTAEGALVLVKPDLIEWASILNRYGEWTNQLRLELAPHDATEAPAAATFVTVAKSPSPSDIGRVGVS